MRLALKHQIIMAPAAVLCLMTLLLFFLQLTYWDMAAERQKAKGLKTAFIALVEADMTTQRMQGVVSFLAQAQEPDPRALEHLSNLYQHLALAIDTLQNVGILEPSSMILLQKSLTELSPQQGLQLLLFDATLQVLRPHIKEQLNTLNLNREELSVLQREDIDALIAKTTFVTIVVLGIAILVGILLSLGFARHILRRIKALSDSAARISAGDFTPPPAPDKVRDELDGLAVSINHMTDQLIRVVAAEKLLEGAEEERRRIAMDIHDQTLADLSAVRRGLETLPQAPPGGDAVVAIETDLQRAMTNLRVVMDNLHPQTLDILGLPAAVESLLEKVCEPQGSPVYHFMAGDSITDLKVSRLTQVTVYRVVVEAINNVLRHAHASQLEVSMTLRGNALVVAVEDNGRGFDHAPKLPTTSGGRGLHNIQERARAIGAQVSWRNSRFSSGTRFELLLPLRDK
jgi:two-component system sensor histidine kinase UhpB